MLSVTEKIVGEESVGRLGKEIDLIIFSHVLEHNESGGIWQGFMLIRSRALSGLSWSDQHPCSLFISLITAVLLGVNFFSFPVSIDSFLGCLLVSYLFCLNPWALGELE